MKTYTTRANARRALKNMGVACVKYGKEIIIEADGKFSIDEDKMEKLMTRDEWLLVYGDTDAIKPSDEKEVAEELTDVFPYTAPAVTKPEPIVEVAIVREAQKTSMKLDRTIICIGFDGEWKNAYRMWKEHTDWMTSSQQDSLTKKLYEAAKRGEKITVEINGRSFELVNVSMEFTK